ncbi:S1 family peptidase [Vibrio astriarenae]|uniref:S1 family peptidase n=1 Tax=Vibrio astriarenae TaxID=1481923 RepID=UPI00373541B0
MKHTIVFSSIVASLSLAAIPAVASTPSARIIDGTPAPEGEWPFIGALIQKGFSASQGQICGASYLGGRYVLTAAHCVENTSSGDIELLFGVNDLDDENQGTRVGVNNIYIHELFDSDRLLYDIAVLELPRELTSDEADAVRLAPEGRLEELYMSGDVTLTVAGWGTIEPSGSTVRPDSLQELDIKLVSREECNAVYGEIPAQNFCAGTPSEGQDSCRGDSGGPIVIKDTGEQLGWVSWGDRFCGRAGSYGVYADAGFFQGWLSQFNIGLSYTQNEHIGYFEPGTVLDHVFTYTNTGTRSASLSNFNLSGTTSTQPAILSNTCSADELLGGESCQVDVQLPVDGFAEFSVALSTDLSVAGESQTLSSQVRYEGVVQSSQTLKDAITFDYDAVYVNDKPWIAATDGIRSGEIGDGQQSVVVIEGVPQGYLSLDVTVSSENGFDVLTARVNDTELDDISGEEQFSARLTLPQTSNTVRFAYAKDGSTAAGDDLALLTNMRFSAPDSNPQVIDGGSGGAVNGFWLFLLGLPLVRRLYRYNIKLTTP